MRFALPLALWLSAAGALAQEKTEAKSDDLDVTMQIIVDPDAKLPDDLVRRIPLPARKPANQPPPTRDSRTKEADRTESAARAREAQELRREMSEHAKERTQDASAQREEALRSAAEERRRNHGPPEDHPPKPPKPPKS